MEQAARSGMTNIPEGFTEKSLAMYIKLAGVAAASNVELLKDYQSYARQHHILIWDKDKSYRDIRELREIWKILKATPVLPDNPNFPDLPINPEIATNLMITLGYQATYFQQKLVQSL
jgi:hypothetical protein